MDRAGSGERSVAKDREDLVEISQSDATPRRGANELKRVPKNRPAQVAGDASHLAGAEIKTLEGLSTEEKQDGKQDEQHGKTERDPRDRALTQRERGEPERAAHYKNEDAGAGEIE